MGPIEITRECYKLLGRKNGLTLLLKSGKFPLFLCVMQIVSNLIQGSCYEQQLGKQQTMNLLPNQQNMQHHQLQNDHRQQTTPTNVMLYKPNNLSLPLNRPLDRPSLTLVNQNAKQSQYNNSNERVKSTGVIEADWFMLGGPGDAESSGDLSTSESRPFHSFGSAGERNISSKHSTRRTAEISRRKTGGRKENKESRNSTAFDDGDSDSSDTNEIYDDAEESSISLAGTQKEPECASSGRYYCTFKEDYPLKLVTEVTKYYKWPLEKLFRDLHAQIMPKLAQDSSGNLVCDSITRVVRPGWARNTNERWLVVINTDNYHQYVTEVICQYGTNSRCNFIPPCYYSSCQQRYNTQKLLVIDPTNPYRGPFLSEFLFPSCCVCYVPSSNENLQDRYRPSPATIYQRTMQQEASANLNPPQFRPTGLMEEVAAGSSFSSNSAGLMAPQTSGSASPPSSNNAVGEKMTSGSSLSTSSVKLTPPEPGEIRRRAGEQYGSRQQKSFSMDELPGDGFSSYRHNVVSDRSEFPSLGESEALVMTNNGPKSTNDEHPERH